MVVLVSRDISQLGSNFTGTFIGSAGNQHNEVRGIRDYGDEGLVEFILAELIYLFKGLGRNQWKVEPEELNGKKIGIIGLGKTGQMPGAPF